MGYQKINIITGWFAFLVALVTYILTVEPTASFWDAGEFIACSYKLQVPHPPGAPFFLLTGRMFSLLAGGDVTQVAYWVNMLSVVSSAFFVLFIFWSITHLAKRALKVKKGEETTTDTILIMGTGLVGALACTFSDSFWFSAVEAEVYGMSAFFTSFVFWAILKWENMTEEQDRARWLILIAYMMGLSIGVHLLNLVAIPVLGLIVYFKYYEKVTRKGIIYTMLISAAIVLIVLEGVIPGLPSVAGKMEIFFVNSFGLPFGSGVIFFGLLVIGGLVYGIYYSIKHNKYVLNTSLLALAFILIGYSSYSLAVIRSNYNPPIDENNPEEIISFVSYLKREQYGSRPLFKGPYYTAELIENKKAGTVYMRGDDEYVIKDYKVEQVYDPAHTTILPRMYSSDPNHVRKYRQVTGLREGEKPSWGDNFYYLIVHQLGHQYFRYFMWNFSGRESDIQGAGWVGIADAFDMLPDVLENNNGRNIYFALPLLLGIIGIFAQYKKDIKLFSATALLFFMTGIAIVLYLNTPPIEPRERDYIYAGSFYIFTIWIGFGILGIFSFAKLKWKEISKIFGAVATATAIAFIFQSVILGSSTDASTMVLFLGTAGVGLIALGKIILQISNSKVLAIYSLLVGLGTNVLLASENWDDHDRSDRYFSVDAAKNYLSSVAPQGVIYTGGDNDTFPLWYVQEVEEFRQDARVLVLSYYNTDWYIQQSAREAYESEPLPYGLPIGHYQQGGLNDYLMVYEREELKGSAINAKLFLKFIKEENPGLQIQPNNYTVYNTIPSRTLFLEVDTMKAKQIVPEDMHDMIEDKMILRIKGRALEKKDLAFLDLLVNSNWDRPIYLNNTSIAQLNIDMRPHVLQEGMAYRVLPIRNSGDTRSGYPVNTEVMYDNVMNKFTWTNLDDPSVYYTQDYLGFVLNSRSTFNTLAEDLISEGDYARAAEVLKKCLEVMPDESVPFDFFSVQQVDMLLKVGEPELADHVAERSSMYASQWLDFYFSTDSSETNELQKQLLSLNEIARAYRANGEREKAAEYEELFNKYYTQLQSGN
ncbi:protein O-mannosyl-transferase family [Ekhidna sp.]|uniref:protein O-mannosyl-transferase family n=1 Tax=Ekhidna sp. TaxID=2608089 RepID=UPI003B5C46FE